MKINGILTFQRAHNHGALLQAFATQSLIKDLGQKSELIDYRNIGTPEFYKEQSTTKRLKFKSLIAHKIRGFFLDRIIIKQNEVYESFQDTYLIYSKLKYSTRLDLINSNIEENYSMIIAGSDQIWNTDISLNDSSYFLDFISESNKKVAFAASFGRMSLHNSNKDYLLNQIKKIKHLSVREKEGANIINKGVGIVPFVCLDPTLILNSLVWEEYMIKPRLNYKYILCFVIGNFSHFTDQACKKVGKDMNLPIVMVNNYGIINRLNKNYKFNDKLSPFELLGLIKDAELVITTSFHGTAFAINFNKEFYALPTSLKSKSSERNSRITNVLEKFNIADRYIKDLNDLNKKIEEQKKINYIDVNKLLAVERNASLSFLKNALK